VTSVLDMEGGWWWWGVLGLYWSCLG